MVDKPKTYPKREKAPVSQCRNSVRKYHIEPTHDKRPSELGCLLVNLP